MGREELGLVVGVGMGVEGGGRDRGGGDGWYCKGDKVDKIDREGYVVIGSGRCSKPLDRNF